MMDVKLTKIWEKPLKLETIKKAVAENNEISEKIRDIVLLKSSRLSVQPLNQSQWDGIIELSKSSIEIKTK